MYDTDIENNESTQTATGDFSASAGAEQVAWNVDPVAAARMLIQAGEIMQFFLSSNELDVPQAEPDDSLRSQFAMSVHDVRGVTNAATANRNTSPEAAVSSRDGFRVG